MRYAFEEMDVEEARTATHLLLTFCKLAGIAAAPPLGQLQQHLDLWRDRSSPLEKSVVIRHMQQELNTAGNTCEDVRSEDFSFHSTGNVRISTLHSCKELDFPVVLLYLPYLHRRAFYADQETDQLLRNLLFVGITRAMDNLNVFIRESDDPILRDLRSSFEKKYNKRYQDNPLTISEDSEMLD